MDRVLHFVLALAVVAILALLVSSDRKKIRIRYVIQLLVIEVLLAWFFLNSDVGLGFVKGFSEMFEKLLGFANEGTNFVFGSMNDQGLAFFFLKVLCPIVFISALIGILQHIRVLPVIIRAIGFLLSKVNGMGKLESFNAVSSLIYWVSLKTLLPIKISSAKSPVIVCTPWLPRQCPPCRCPSLVHT